jgi:hypothetical protein
MNYNFVIGQLFQKFISKLLFFWLESYPLPGGPDTIQDT